MALLEAGDYDQATVPLTKAARLAPEKTLDPRGARPRLLPQPALSRGGGGVRGRRRALSGQRLRALLPRPRADLCGQPDRARRHLAIAANLRPERRDYRLYRERLRPQRLRALVQRVSRASVRRRRRAARGDRPGLLVLLGVATATTEQADRLADKVRALRVFEDADGQMNEPLGEREVLCVSQFTLYADTRKGNRPELRRRAPRSWPSPSTSASASASAPSAGGSAPGWRSSWSTTAR